MDTQNRGLTPEQQAAMAQLQQSMENNQTQAQAAPTPSVQPLSAGGASATSSLRQQMQRERSGAPQETTPTVMQQGNTYNPQGAQPVQPQAGATSTIINTSTINNTPTESNNTLDGKEKKSFNPKVVIGIFIGFAVVLVALLVFSKPGSSNGDEPVVDNPTPDEELEWIVPDVSAETYYTADQIAALREVGYTGDEIEQFAAEYADVNTKIKEAEAIRDAWVQEAITPLYDATSQEYKDFIGQTWLTLPERKDLDQWGTIAGYYENRQNLDYEKVTTYGNQLFIKIYLDDATHADWFFQCVTPEEWSKLKDSGNVIVTYRYCTKYNTGVDGFNVEDFDNIFITNATLEIIE